MLYYSGVMLWKGWYNMNLSTENKAWLDATWQKVDSKMKKVAVRSRNKLPYTTDENGVHDDRAQTNVTWWANGFWGGMMWLLYMDTKNEDYKITAENSELLLDKAFENFDGLHHDVGFMWHITSGINYRYTGNEKARIRTLYAASILASRYNVEGGYITAWNGEAIEGGSIIDCMMNLPLLYWASDELGLSRYRAIAIKHADMTMKDHIRPDGSINHIVIHDVHSPEIDKIAAGQGYELGSCWSRGQAWALYGFALAYRHTGKEEYLDIAKKCANYFIAASCKDWMPRCDFRSPVEPVLYDSTASACAASGLIEIASLVGEYEKDMYLDAAINLLKACDEHFCNYDENIDHLVAYGTGRYPHPEYRREVHCPIIYGDYYYIEALFKLRGNEFQIW